MPVTSIKQVHVKVWEAAHLLVLERCMKPGQPVIRARAIVRGCCKIVVMLDQKVHCLAYLNYCKLPSETIHVSLLHPLREGDHVSPCQHQRVVTPRLRGIADICLEEMDLDACEPSSVPQHVRY